jgi:hypothetical protein
MSLDCRSTSPRSRALSLLLVNKGRARSLSLLQGRGHCANEARHFFASQPCPSAGPGNRTTTRLVTRSFAHFHRISSPGHASRPPAPFYKTARPRVLETKISPGPVPSTQQAPLVYRSEFFTHFAILFLNLAKSDLSFGNRKTWFQRKRGKEKKIRKVNKRRRQNNDMGQGVIPPRNAISPARWAAVLLGGNWFFWGPFQCVTGFLIIDSSFNRLLSRRLLNRRRLRP